MICSPHNPIARTYRDSWLTLVAVVLGCTLATGTSVAQNLQDTQLEQLPGVWAGQAAWGDYDDDGDLDLALIGETLEDGACERIAQVFRNDDDLLVEDTAQTDRLRGTYFGDVAWADYDDDGDLDLGIVGWDSGGTESLRLYLNEPGTEAPDRSLNLDLSQVDEFGTSNFRGVRYASLAWADYDNDGDVDLIVSGMVDNGTSLTQVYRNTDGVLQMDAVNSEAVINVHHGDLAWADYDNDGDLDLALSGENVTFEGGIYGAVTEFYRNDPVGSLGLDSGLDLGIDPDTGLPSRVKGGSLAWADYDQDGNLDLAVSGRDEGFNAVLNLFRNRPAGNLSPDPNFPLSRSLPLRVDGELDWTDYDNDGDLDLAVAGRTILSAYRALVLENRDGAVTGVSVETNVRGLAGGAAAWADYNGDGRVDLLLSGVDESGERQTVLYDNLGTPVANRPPDPPATLNPVKVSSSRVVFSWPPGQDVESPSLSYNLRIGSEPGGGDILSARTPVGPGNVGLRTDFVLQRSLPPDQYYWSVQSVDGAFARSEFSSEGIFVVVQFVSSDQRLRSLSESSMSWGDVDDDGDPDLAIMGTNRSGEPQSLLYVNRAGTLTLDIEADLPQLSKGDLEWGDYDGDGDLDLFITGEVNPTYRISRLYRTEASPDTPRLAERLRLTPEVTLGSATWGDVDNDGDLDLLLMGQSGQVVDGTQMSVTRVWVNDGLGSFDPTRDDSLIGLNNGEAAWADLDLDGDLDLAVNGKSSEGVREFRLYRNDLPGPLQDSGLDLPGVESGDLAWGDYDRDGDVDLIACGLTVDGTPTTWLFDNTDGALALHPDASFAGIQGGDLAWGDVDNDQDLDLLVVGNDGNQPIFRVYENTIGRISPDAAFEALDIGALTGVDFSSVALADIDDDGDLDLISSGQTASYAPQSSVNDNLTAQQFNANFPPAPPASLAATDSADAATLTWLAGSDDGSPPVESLTYTLRVGTAPGGDDVVSGEMDLGTGNTGHNLSRRLLGLVSGTYYWAVQTVDAGFATSEWSPTASFMIDTVPPLLDTFITSRQEAGIGQTVTLALEFADANSGVDADISPDVQAAIGDSTYSFKELQFTGTSWSGELTIAGDMPSGTAVVSVAGLVDHKSNILVPRDSVTIFTLDTDLPAIVDRDPTPGASGVSASLSEITITFSELLEPAIAEAAGNYEVRLARGDETVAVTPSYDAATLMVDLDLEEQLLPGAEYTVEVSAAIEDLVGNRPANAISWSFHTAVPQLLETDPAADAVDVPAGSRGISATFDNGISRTALSDAGAVRVLREGQAVSLQAAASFDDATGALSFELAEALKAGSRYEVVLSGLLAGPLRAVAEGDFRWRFDTAVPALTGAAPDSGAAGVKTDLIEAVATFSTPLDDDLAVADNFVLLREGEEVSLRSGDPVVRDDGRYGFAPAAGWQVGSSYTVRISPVVTGPLGVTQPLTWQFQTAAPTIAQVSPADGDTAVSALEPNLTVTFDSDIDESALPDPAVVRVTRGGQSVSLRGAPVFDGTTRTLTFAIDAGLRVGSQYEVVVSGLLAGPLRVISEGDFSWGFATAVPQLSVVSPDSNAVVVAGDLTEVVASFSIPLDDDKVEAANFSLLREGEPVSLRSGDPVVRGDGAYGFAPAESWQVGSSYAVQISPVVTGPLGGAKPLTWHFQTAVPAVVAVAPTEGDSTVSPLEPALTISFDSAIDEAELRADLGTVLLEEGISIGVGTPVYDAGSRTVTIAPPEGLRAGSSYSVQISSAVGGPGAIGAFGWRFSTLVPDVAATTPADDDVINSGPRRVQVVFSSPVDADLRTSRNFRLTASGEDLALADEEFLYDETSFVVSLPEIDFQSGAAYELTVSSRLGGPRADRPDRRVSFRTEIPGVIATSPEDGDEGVSTTETSMRVEFSVPVARPELQLFEVRARALAEVLLHEDDAPFELVPLTGFGMDPAGTAINFSLVSGLRPFTEYQIDVSREVLGELASEGFSWTFQTASHLADAAVGGTISNRDGSVELYFAPNGLSGGTGEIIIAPVDDVPLGKLVAAPAQAEARTMIGRAFRIEAGTAILRKPATLTLRHGEGDLGDRDPMRLGVFSYSGSDWTRVGGTPDAADRSVTTTVDELGIFALFEDLATPVGSVAVSDVDCQPRAFDPDGQALRSQTDISFQLTTPADVTIRVYNASGRLERVLTRDAPMAPGRNTSPSPWNGRDEDGDIVASGLYIVVVTAGDSQDEQVVAVVR